jgi:hypothetical protein
VGEPRHRANGPSPAGFKVLENSKLAKLLAASGAELDASDRAEIRELGSEAAERKVAEPPPYLHPVLLDVLGPI